MISVIMATYNGTKYIIEQLESIRLQTRQPYEVIIADDCSKDNTYILIQDYITKYNLKNWKLIRNIQNKGFQANFLDLLLLAKGEIIFFADQDDIWHPQKLECMEYIMQNNENIWTLSCGYQFIDSNGNPLSSSRLKSRRRKDDGNLQKVMFNDFLNWWSYPGMSMAIKKSMLEYLPIINTPNIIAHDWALNLISCYQEHFYFLDKNFVKYRQHCENVVGGIVNISHDFNEERIITVNKIINHYYQAEFILKKIIPSDLVCKKHLDYLSRKTMIYERRRRYLENTNILGCLSLSCFIKYYPRKRAYFGDLLCCVKLMLKK